MSADARRTHDGWGRSPRRDAMALYRRELEEEAEMDGLLQEHLLSRLRRAMLLHRNPVARDFALAGERLYRVTVDPAVPAAERRRALGSWMLAMKELERVERRLSPRRRPLSVFTVPRAGRKRARVSEDEDGDEDQGDAEDEDEGEPEA